MSRLFNDVYFSRDGGVAETEYVFLQHNHLPQRWENRHQFVIAETGFGSGLNFVTTVYHWLNSSKDNSHLFYISVEKYPLLKSDLKKAQASWPQFAQYSEELIRYYPPAIPGFHRISLFNNRVTLLLLLGDVEIMLQQLHANVDAWFLDGFSPARNPEMWTETVFSEIARLSKADATFSSYTAAGYVRRGLAAQGFDVSKVKGCGNKNEMLQGHIHQKPVNQSKHPWYEIPVSSFKSKRVAVIGAGIAGMTTAHALAKRGWQVDVLERNSGIASEGSGNPAGVLLPRI
ncbi:MAG TPA: tRNA (5-methylaminomethyl-2-thiouridine)(34)-methyltransferase MnmD, partial [Gammaproteobacteria bacterium]